MNHRKIQSPKGTRDILPEEQHYWRHLLELMQNIARTHGYDQLVTPIFEETLLFQRGVGESTDIVEKEMYTFQDKSEHSMTLRPEFTAGVVRSFIQNGMSSWSKPVKLWSTGPIFRYERPQAGRYRQFHQFNVEAFGEMDPALDFEIMCVAWRLYDSLGFKKLNFQLNSIGCKACRPVYLEHLKSYYHSHSENICTDCQNRLDKNPLRLLDCKQQQCQPFIVDAPVITDHLCEECDSHFTQLKKYLNDSGQPYTMNPLLVRGLDYYTKTVFEVWAEGIGSQNAVCGGGRYDGLVEILGGPPTPAVGFAAGLERIVMVLKAQEIEVPPLEAPKVYFVCQHAHAQQYAMKIIKFLREMNISCIMGFGGRSFKAQFREADRRGVSYVATIGDDEIRQDKIHMKHMKTGEQKMVSPDEIIRFLQGV